VEFTESDDAPFFRDVDSPDWGISPPYAVSTAVPCGPATGAILKHMLNNIVRLDLTFQALADSLKVGRVVCR
jgi:hypothetical protein